MCVKVSLGRSKEMVWFYSFSILPKCAKNSEGIRITISVEFSWSRGESCACPGLDSSQQCCSKRDAECGLRTIECECPLLQRATLHMLQNLGLLLFFLTFQQRCLSWWCTGNVLVAPDLIEERAVFSPQLKLVVPAVSGVYSTGTYYKYHNILMNASSGEEFPKL